MNELTPPEKCPACGLLESETKEEGYDKGFLMFPLPNLGVCMCTCPRCFNISMNRECFDVQDAPKKGKSRIIQLK